MFKPVILEVQKQNTGTSLGSVKSLKTGSSRTNGHNYEGTKNMPLRT